MIKDESTRKRLAALGIDDYYELKECAKKLNNLEELLNKVQKRLSSIDISLEEARNLKKKISIADNLELVDNLDSKINDLSVKKISFEKKFQEIKRYLEKEKENIKQSR